MRKIQRIRGNRTRTNYRVLRWDIIEACNYKCDYCIKDVYYKKKRYIPYKDAINWINVTLKNVEKPVIVQLFGGEPTLHPNFWEICNSLQVPFGLYTNLSQSIDFYDKLCEIQNFIYMICSLHYSQETDVTNFYSKIERLLQKNIMLNIAVFLENKNLEKIEKSFLTLKEIVQDGGCVYFNNETTDSNYYRNIDISYFNKYMLPEQKMSILYNDNTREEITELDATMLRLTNKLNLRGFVCECNKYGNFILDTDGSLYTCVSNSPISSIYNYHIDIFKYNKCICLNNSCHPYLLEYGIKERIK